MGSNEIRRFLSWKSVDLKIFLRERGVPLNNEKHRELAEKAFWAEKLGLPVKPTDEEAEKEIEQSKRSKLVFDGGIVNLPRPESLTVGWEVGQASLPDTCRDYLDSYIKAGNRRIGLENTEGKRTLALGKTLYMSGHVRALQYHGISGHLSYCFVRGKVIPQQKTSEAAYNTWVVLIKETGHISTGECTCCVGIQATCKHIAALLFAVVEAVEQGRNCSSTSQQQAWGKAPKKGQGLHEPQFAKDIKIVGIKQDVSQQFADNNRNYRSEFDPRVRAHQVEKPLCEFNLACLASVTNGNCGLFVHCKLNPSPDHASPDIANCCREECIETLHPVLTVQEAYNKTKETGLITSTAVLQVSRHQQEVLANQTSNQALSDLWKNHRKGRITASVAGDCIGSVKGDNISGHSQIAKVMGYYGNPQSAALSWGKNQEAVSRKHYIAYHKRTFKHTGVQCKETGLWVSLICPYVAASPDGIITCRQCGTGLLELKNPYANRHMTIDELANHEGSCLCIENGIVILNRTHAYYAQVQIQMWTTGYKWCDFVVRTVSQRRNLFVERVLFDGEYIQSIQQNLKLFFLEGILPELASREIQNKVISRAVMKTMDDMLSKLDVSMDPSSTMEYPCGICEQACERNPTDIEHNSICCDNCDRWFHYMCVDISGNEQFLQKRRGKWKCVACSSRKRKCRTYSNNEN